MRLAAIAAVLLFGSVTIRSTTQQTQLDLAAFVGVWKEDVAKRQSGKSSGLPYTFTQEGTGSSQSCELESNCVTGCASTGKITKRPEGREYIAQNPNALPEMTTLAETLGSRSLRRSTLRSHKPIFEIVMTVSSDGKTLTVTNRTIGIAEAAVHIYDKQY